MRKYQYCLVVAAVTLLVSTMFFCGCLDGGKHYTDDFTGTWQRQDRDDEMWTFYSNGDITISGRKYTFEYWFDNEGFYWYSIKDDPAVQAKYNWTLEDNNGTLILDRIGIKIRDSFQTGTPETIILTRIE